MKAKYQAVSGARFSHDDAQIIGPILANLARVGASSADQIVAEAAKKSSPLHEYFEWSDDVAANFYRLEQARYMARSIVVISGKDRTPIRAFHAVTVVHAEEGELRQYKSNVQIRRVQEYRDQIVGKAYSELLAWRI